MIVVIMQQTVLLGVESPYLSTLDRLYNLHAEFDIINSEAELRPYSSPWNELDPYYQLGQIN